MSRIGRGWGRAEALVSTTSSEASIKYLTNALGQRVFKSEPQVDRTLPSEEELGVDFIAWLKKGFGWLFTQTQTNTTSIGTVYVYGDGPLPTWALLGEYDNGSAYGRGRTEYIWLPTEDGSAIPVGMYRNGKFFAIHSDHLGTPRLMTDDTNKPIWQWPYSAFGSNKPTGVLKATPNPRAALTNQPVLLKATAAKELNLRFPGQYADDETGQFYNYFRSYDPRTGRYIQADPIGLAGGLNRFAYVAGRPLDRADPRGLRMVCYVPGGCVYLPDPIIDPSLPPGVGPNRPPNWTPSWEDDLDSADNGPKNEFQFWRCKTDEDRDCRNRLIQLKFTYTKIKLGDLLGLNTFSLKEAYNAVARRYMRECPNWERVPLFWLFGK
jgi:RHS repeat-associated protein